MYTGLRHVKDRHYHLKSEVTATGEDLETNAWLFAWGETKELLASIAVLTELVMCDLGFVIHPNCAIGYYSCCLASRLCQLPAQQ